jgi:hypothetical protein
MDPDHVVLGLTGNAKVGQTLDDTLGEVENGTAHVHGGFDGVQKGGFDPKLYDDDGKPHRTGACPCFALFPSCVFCFFCVCVCVCVCVCLCFVLIPLRDLCCVGRERVQFGSAHHHGGDRLGRAGAVMELRADGVDSGAGSAAGVRVVHLLHLAAAGRLLPVA